MKIVTTALLCGTLLGGAAISSGAMAQGGTDPRSIRIPTPPSAGIPAPPPPARAPSPEAAAVREKITAYMKRPEVAAAVQAVIKRQVTVVPGVCNGMKFSPTNMIVTQKPEFDADGVMRAGVVRQAYAGAGCGTRKPVINVWLHGQRAATPDVKASFPGTSVADPKLQADFTVTAMANAAMSIAGCKAFQVIDTRFAGFEGTSPTVVPGRDARRWKEEWLLRGCGKAAVVVMHFEPDATGTTGKTSNKETRLLQPQAPAPARPGVPAAPQAPAAPTQQKL